MKKLLLVLAIGAFAACGEGTTDNETTMDSAANSTLDSSTVMPTDTSATAPADSSAAQTDSAASN